MFRCALAATAAALEGMTAIVEAELRKFPPRTPELQIIIASKLRAMRDETQTALMSAERQTDRFVSVDIRSVESSSLVRKVHAATEKYH
jgi:hypothetical protein